MLLSSFGCCGTGDMSYSNPWLLLLHRRAILQTVIKSAARQAKTAEKLLTTSHGSPTRFVGLRVQQAIMLRLEGKLDEAERNLW